MWGKAKIIAISFVAVMVMCALELYLPKHGQYVKVAMVILR